MLSADNRHKRPLFAQEHSSSTVADWQNVVFTDESAFTTRWDKRQQIWRADRTRFNPINFQHVDSSGRCFASVWGALSKDGLRPLVRLDGHFNATAYMDLVETVLLPIRSEGVTRSHRSHGYPHRLSCQEVDGDALAGGDTA
ncbi:hypothetical protein HPB47_002962 [Ixodes persulcatus]|uniref:Uncharacterized protein n=1 Tax=Ixodes persulcatus TaxID=34615 RepID=A0AC60PJY3_IXOPE|nr:hypothetical protein HPB47_002962 [Ixodes persulcatus]